MSPRVANESWMGDDNQRLGTVEYKGSHKNMVLMELGRRNNSLPPTIWAKDAAIKPAQEKKTRFGVTQAGQNRTKSRFANGRSFQQEPITCVNL